MNRTTTTNGAGAFVNTGNPLVTLFFNIGASRNNLEGIRKDFKAAFEYDAMKATAILLFARDIRHNGAGERQVFRTLLKDLITMDKGLSGKTLVLIPEIGRFDDLRVAYGTIWEEMVAKYWHLALQQRNVLAAKWAKREDKVLQKAIGVNEAGLRKLLSSIRKEHIVETKMCEKNFSSIEYGKLPSVAGMRYAKAFGRNDSERYSAFIDSKETKVNASVAFPHDVYRMCKSGDQREAASKYWAALPELDIVGSILPVVDVSGSMMCPASGSITCLDVAVSLGTYLSQRVKGKFQNTLVTFSESPTIVTLPKTDDIGELFNFVMRMNWGMNTNIEKVFKVILDKALKLNATQADLPTHILIMSDMQFDCVSGLRNDTVFENMRKQFEAAGFKLPAVIFWNLSASYGNVPTTAQEKNVGLVSGFSPNVLKAVLAAKEITPISIMEESIAPFIEMLK